MNFELNEDQSALADSLSRLLADRYGFDQRRALVSSGATHDRTTWDQLAELGLTALPLPESHGGFGGGARDLFPVMQALGRTLCIEPFMASAVLAGTAIRLGADDGMQDQLLPTLATGESLIAFAHQEAGARHAPLWIETRAQRKGGGWVLSGSKSLVLALNVASKIVVSARVSGAAPDADGCALFVVDANAPGVTLREFRLVDDSMAGELQLDEAAAQPLSDPLDAQRARSAIQGTLNTGIAAACADMLGAAQAAFDLAMDYLRTRKQFGRLIGENQALRHRASEMLVNLEMVRSMAMAAAIAADTPDGEDAQLDLHRAKLSVGRNARLVAHGAIQLHGGIGMTEEYAVGHSLRRIHVMDQLFGDADAHAARLAAI